MLYTCAEMLSICVKMLKYKCSNIDDQLGIFTHGYYPYPAGYGYGISSKPGVRVWVWAENFETGAGMSM